MRELTAMQAAYWVGRNTTGALGGVAAHLYAEFDGDAVDPERLRQAVRRLFRVHDMLRLSVGADALQSVVAVDPRHDLAVDDLRRVAPQAAAVVLADKRRAKSHQRLDLENGQAVELELSLLPGGGCRLHVDLDMIAVDPSGLRLLMEDLARFYDDPMADAAGGSFFDHQGQVQADSEYARQQQEDRVWWRQRLEHLPPAPPLPWRQVKAGDAVRSERFAGFIPAAERHRLDRVARRHGMTLTTLTLGAFALVLGRHTQARRLRLNVPTFFRRPGTQGLLGDFSEVLIVGTDLGGAGSLLALCRALAAEVAQALSHSAYSGISVMRDLSRRQGGVQLSPVVFTSGLGMPGGELFSPQVTRCFGQMVWAISQAPQVALDAQVATAYGGILVNWDVRLDALPEIWVRALFDDYLTCLRHIAKDDAAMTAPLDHAFPPSPQAKEMPLTALQQAYLLGRSQHLPLGGVAMQEFREYRGHIDAETLRRRLDLLVSRHDALRTLIDERGLTQRVDPIPQVNLDELDLRHLTPGDAWSRIDSLRPDYAHQMCDLSGPPWHLLLIHLPAGAEDSHLLFARFDALILDGQGIAGILADLLSTAEPAPAGETQGAIRVDPANREADAAYWAATLRDFPGAPRLPWRRPLSEIRASRYGRQRVVLPAAELAALTRLGAGLGLFRNSILSALLLDVLVRWCEDTSAGVAVPVALPHGGRLGNGSSFVPLAYDGTVGTLEERARRLQGSLLDGLDHLAFSGVDLNRLLLGRHGEGPALPVVLTNGLSWRRLESGGTVRLHDGLTQTPQTALDIRMTLDEAGNLDISADYAVEALAAETVEALLAAMGRALHAVARDQKLELRGPEIVDLGHYRHNGRDADFVCSGFLRRLADNLFGPGRDAVALICGEQSIRYGQLGDKVALLMSGLARRELAAGAVVAICLPRGPDHVALTVACALRGVIWVPVDAASPPDRLRTLLATCRPDLVVGRGAVEGWEVVAPEDLEQPTAPDIVPDPGILDERSRGDAPAYYLFTSGTTGKPKCVVLCNRATSNVVASTQARWRVTTADVFISVTPLHHDMSVFDLFGALSAGIPLVLPQAGEEKDALAWNRLVKRHGVTVWCSVPAILEMLLACRQGDELKTLRLVAQGGDYIKPTTIATLRDLLPECRLFSLGGPTETTIWSIWHELNAEDRTVIPYGRPLPCCRYYILSESGEHCPPGTVGRIHTAGLGLALGYLEDGALVHKDFVTIADENGQPARAFRTGDLGFYRPDGTIVFAGRVNGYVKVRGIRVSLPDVENELAAHPMIERVLVVDYGDARTGEVALAALYVGDDIPPAELRAFARRHLPETLVPSRFLRVADLPLSANGKPDRARARALVPAGGEAEAAPSATTREQRVLDIYLAAIGTPRRGEMNDDSAFVELGLLPSHLRHVASRLRQEFGVDLSPGRLAPCRNARQVTALLP